MNAPMKKIALSRICFTGCLYAILSVRTTIAAPPPTLAVSDWSVNVPYSLAKKPPSLKEVAELLGLENATASGSSLCSFTFANLRRTGTLSLVAAFDSSGRGFCNDIEIVDRTAFGFESTDLPTTEIGQGVDVSKLIKDISGNGQLELVINTTVGGYQGGVHCGVEWPVIYAWTGSNYADVSTQFKSYYRQRLANIMRQISAPPTPIKPNSSESSTSKSIESSYQGQSIQPQQVLPMSAPKLSLGKYRRDCLKAEAAKTERFLGTSSDAGMTDAIKWSESEDPLTRDFAASVFNDIGTPEAINHLRTLAADSDRSVAAGAKDSLHTTQAEALKTNELESTPWTPTDN
jgi:hypothetical protein